MSTPPAPPAVPSTVEAPIAAATTDVVPEAAPIAREKTAPARPRPAGTDDALHAEVALLDRVRDALHEHASARALRLLDQHRRRFARGTLAPEAEALRIEALVQGGAYAQAESMSQRFVSAYPQHPLSEHVAKLAAASQSQSSSAR